MQRHSRAQQDALVQTWTGQALLEVKRTREGCEDDLVAQASISALQGVGSARITPMEHNRE